MWKTEGVNVASYFTDALNSGYTANAHAIIQIRQESSTLSFNFVTDTVVN